MMMTETAVDTTVDTADTNTVSEDIATTTEVTDAAEQTNEADAVAEVEQQEGLTQTEGDPSQDRIFTPVYNGAVIPIRASDTERVTTLLQKGMKFERMAEDLEKLHQLKAVYGAKTTAELLDGMLERRESAVRAAYAREYGEKAADRVLALEKAERAAKVGTFREADQTADKASLQTLHERLAREFIQLKAEHSEITAFRDVPRAVIETALQTGVPLPDAFNRHILNEQTRVAQAAQKQASNQQSAVGSLSDSGGDATDPVTEAMLRGVWRRQ